ncbi:MAG TPA: hypothetical protein VHX38_05635 [Pseudonocardiaceae bacterium]|jgi:hypothetical protein|nr:hypothetical protein [Pseudonocardiaceae bacterium]
MLTVSRLGLVSVVVSSRISEEAQLAGQPVVLKVLLQQRHLQGHRAFCREYDKIAAEIDRTLERSWPSRAQFYRWLSGELLGLPYADHCRILERMFPGWTAQQLFEAHGGGIEFVPEPPEKNNAISRITKTDPPKTKKTEVVDFYSHRSETSKKLWMDLLLDANANIDLLANASLFLPEDNPESIEVLKEKAANGVKIRIIMGNPDHPAMALRGREERLFEAIPGRIKMALAYYRPLVGIDGVEFRLHGTALYNSIFRYDDEMLVNQHIYGAYGYIAPILHLRRTPGLDLFETYLKSFDLIWSEESRDILEEATSRAQKP